jgi:hypothetical protein|tara:strand:- start:497 stop:880 length:384 start_codon:yes stop_codon:yes gene_type:complete
MLNLVKDLLPQAEGILDRFIPNKEEARKAQAELEKAIHDATQAINLEQIKLNQVDAKGNWFQSSWRPATGWVCVIGMAVNFLISPIAAGFGMIIPQADTGTMMPVLMGLLGLGGLRSFEKTKGVAKQ